MMNRMCNVSCYRLKGVDEAGRQSGGDLYRSDEFHMFRMLMILCYRVAVSKRKKKCLLWVVIKRYIYYSFVLPTESVGVFQSYDFHCLCY